MKSFIVVLVCIILTRVPVILAMPGQLLLNKTTADPYPYKTHINYCALHHHIGLKPFTHDSGIWVASALMNQVHTANCPRDGLIYYLWQAERILGGWGLVGW